MKPLGEVYFLEGRLMYNYNTQTHTPDTPPPLLKVYTSTTQSTQFDSSKFDYSKSTVSALKVRLLKVFSLSTQSCGLLWGWYCFCWGWMHCAYIPLLIYIPFPLFLAQFPLFPPSFPLFVESMRVSPNFPRNYFNSYIIHFQPLVQLVKES